MDIKNYVADAATVLTLKFEHGLNLSSLDLFMRQGQNLRL